MNKRPGGPGVVVPLFGERTSPPAASEVAPVDSVHSVNRPVPDYRHEYPCSVLDVAAGVVHVTVLATSETVALEEAYQAAKRRGCRNIIDMAIGHMTEQEMANRPQ
ncbi:hypothetical protein QCD60_29900 [Pokkaliibacter sp. MBI-7]|uniref:hypothetical protein n=1 Tax=Pokkaliibacter sp. MBI-7 TaxID=3040600 RepID=UPI002448AA0D|nr:hypothetical protein [Pokkaliibacter sp. MBI-7]MDH2431034.1 hypothetical protein [Pokkaliibacter sp. MBI-7]MDH2436729.1 hypothetical protein [Pokkaliibacter sp. MBI-7]